MFGNRFAIFGFKRIIAESVHVVIVPLYIPTAISNEIIKFSGNCTPKLYTNAIPLAAYGIQVTLLYMSKLSKYSVATSVRRVSE